MYARNCWTIDEKRDLNDYVDHRRSSTGVTKIFMEA